MTLMILQWHPRKLLDTQNPHNCMSSTTLVPSVTSLGLSGRWNLSTTSSWSSMSTSVLILAGSSAHPGIMGDWYRAWMDRLGMVFSNQSLLRCAVTSMHRSSTMVSFLYSSRSRLSSVSRRLQSMYHLFFLRLSPLEVTIGGVLVMR